MPLEGIRIFFILIIAKDNEVVYEALLVGLRMAKQAGVERFRLQCDFRLVVNQVNGEFKAKDYRMI